MKLIIYSLFCYAIVFLVGCTTQSVKLEQQATAHGFIGQQLIANAFLLTVFKNKPICNNNKLHVYIAGDGNPWLRHHQVAFNPTPSHLLVLDLMSLDTTSSLYLGRPCYHGQHQSKQCHPLLWTHWRYSSTVVDTMVVALQQVLEPHPACAVSLVGYSGGGTLAMLIAARLPNTRRVITVSGNLDVEAWAQYHDYSPLFGSLNPATEPALSSTISQIHLIGNADDNIPADIVLPFLKSQTDSEILQFPKADHNCCWTEIWPDILKRLEMEEEE